MRYRVIENFRSLTQRFSVGDEIEAVDIDGVIRPEDWQRLGKIEELQDLSAPTTSDLPAVTEAALEAAEATGAA